MAVRSDEVVALVRLAVQGLTTSAPTLGASLWSYLGGRVIAPVVVDADVGSLLMPMLVVDVGGGPQHYSGGLAALAVDLYVYDASNVGRARAAYAVLSDALRNVRLYDPQGVIALAGYLREDAAPIEGYNDAVKAHFCRGTWIAHVAV